MTKKERAQSPDQAAPQTFDTADSTTTFALLPPSGMVCAVCGTDTDAADITAVVETYHRSGSGIGIAVGVCRSCCREHAPTQQALDTLIARIRADDSITPRIATTPPAGYEITLPPRKRGNLARRHPAYGARLAADPPPADHRLTVAVGWEHAKQLPVPLIVVQPDDNPTRLRFDVAAGRPVRVTHPASSDPDWLLKLAQALIDEGAVCVDLTVHPSRTGTTAMETLRIRPEVTR